MVVLRKMIRQAQGRELVGSKRLQEKAALVFKNAGNQNNRITQRAGCLLYTSPSPRDS